MQIETEEQQIARLRVAEPPEMRKLRFMLAIAFAGSRLYRDDGEYSDPASRIDFRRDSVPDIERKMRAYSRRMYDIATKVNVQDEPPTRKTEMSKLEELKPILEVLASGWPIAEVSMRAVAIECDALRRELAAYKQE